MKNCFNLSVIPFFLFVISPQSTPSHCRWTTCSADSGRPWSSLSHQGASVALWISWLPCQPSDRSQAVPTCRRASLLCRSSFRCFLLDPTGPPGLPATFLPLWGAGGGAERPGLGSAVSSSHFPRGPGGSWGPQGPGAAAVPWRFHTDRWRKVCRETVPLVECVVMTALAPLEGSAAVKKEASMGQVLIAFMQRHEISITK